MEKKIDTRLSYSSANLLENCSQKYWHYKVNETKKDSDAPEDYEAFAIGKAFHAVLEKTRHDEKPTTPLIIEMCRQENASDHVCLVAAMVMKYFKLHVNSGLQCVAVEFILENDIFVGFVDAVLKDQKGFWWIVDLKTVSPIAFGPQLFARLKSDVQLNLYASFKDTIAKTFGLDQLKFKGVRYRPTVKPKLKQKANETDKDHTARLFYACESYDIPIEAHHLNPLAAYTRHKKTHELSLKLRSGTAEPKPNYSYCTTYFKPCEYWSQCHGANFTDAKKSLQVFDSSGALYEFED